MLAPSAPARAPSGTSAAPRQKSRFSQAAPPVESEQQAPDERKPKESNSRPAESAADSPSSRRRPTDRERERDVVRDTLKIVPADRPPAQEDRSVSPFQSPAADSQRQRKRLPLPSQSAIFREGSRQAPARPDAGYPAFPPAAGPRDSTFPSKPAANDPSIPSGPRISPLVPPRDSPDRHWPSRVPPSGPAASSTSRARMDSYVPNEPVTSRDRDVMDTDELPSATASSKSFEPPSRPSATNYIGAEDQVDSLPKGPRAMAGRNIPPDAPPAGGNMESTSHPNLERSRSARNERESRPSILPQEDRGRHYERTISPLEDPPYRPRAPPDSSRAQGNWDPPPREQGRRQWDHSRRSPGAKPSNLKVSGANGTPIGDRSNRFASASESPHPPKALMTPIDSRIQPPPGGPGDASGARAPRQSNGLKESYERPPHLDASLGTRRHSFAAAGPPAGLHRQPVDRIVSPTLPRRPVSPGVGIQNGPASRQTRSGPTHSRFGPPVQRQEPERLYIPRNPSPESLRSAPRYPEEHSHSGVPSPPMSRDSSMASVWDPPAHHPPRPARSPVRRPESPRHRGAEVYPPPRRDEYEGARRYEERHRDSDRARVPPAPRPTSHRYDSDDVKAHPHSMPSPAPSRPYPAEPARQSFLDARGDHYVARDERGVGAEHTRPPRREASPVRKVHPERELLLQSSYAPYPRSEHEGDRRAPRHSEGVSPLPLPPASYGRPEIVDRAYDVGRRPHDHRLEERYRDVDGGMARGDHRGRGTSLLDRLSLDESPSLRDRVQLPAKRDRDEMDGDGDEEGGAMDVDGEDFDGSKRSRRRGAVKPRRARRVM
ncbi:hypothetical protein BV22DRAFT_1035177 [Leucogyrophana mollusca]|uniref:Uncharacterized protein n=1 Tax=Leucogyrophana mollusca TaxID=85980 RepID=A0ACB8BF53_9AGAM|nr:hypothetical protein BV22DRAFT_1035177 [Leucogyrophana mollusca]